MELPASHYSESITYGARPQKWQHQIRSGGHTPLSERLPEIFGMGLKTKPLCGIEQTSDSCGGIDCETTDAAQCPHGLSLKKVIHDIDRRSQVHEELSKSPIDNAGEHSIVSFSDRFENEAVEPSIEFVRRSIYSHKPIDVFLCSGICRRRACGEDTQNRYTREANK